MEIKELRIKGVFEIIPKPIMDNRGFFMRVFDKTEFKEAGLDKVWVQENHSRTERKGIIRGLHSQLAPMTETKLIRCIKGEIFDVVVDLRFDSPTFGNWLSVVLSEDNYKFLFIPRGFAHGFCTLSEVSEVIYKVDNYYSPENEIGIMWNDPFLNIAWPHENPVLSKKDNQNISLQEYIKRYKST